MTDQHQPTNSACLQTRFQFLFGGPTKSAAEMYELVQRVLAAYAATFLYRDLKLRGNLISNGKLVLLPNEQAGLVGDDPSRRHQPLSPLGRGASQPTASPGPTGVHGETGRMEPGPGAGDPWSGVRDHLPLRLALAAARPVQRIYTALSGEWNGGSCGPDLLDGGKTAAWEELARRKTLWSRDPPPSCALPPSLQMMQMSLRDSKYGTALVIRTSARAGGYTLGFQVENAEDLPKLLQELQSVWQIYSENPEYGTGIALELEGMEAKNERAEELLASLQVTDDGSVNDPLLVYSTTGDGSADARPPVYSSELGLAIEALPADATLERLWSVAY